MVVSGDVIVVNVTNGKLDFMNYVTTLKRYFTAIPSHIVAALNSKFLMMGVIY